MQKQGNLHLFKNVGALALSQRWLLGCAIALTVACAVIAVLKPWPLKVLADVGLGQDQQADSIFSILPQATVSPMFLVIASGIASLCIAALNSATDAGLAWTWTVLGQRLARGLSTDLYGRMLRLPLSVFRRYQLGDLLSRLTTDTWAVSKLMNSLLITPATTVLSIGIMFFVSFRLDRELAFYAFLTAPLMAFATVYFSKRIRNQNRKSREAHGRFASFVQQTLSSMALVQVFNAGDRNARRFSEFAQEATALNERGLILSRSRALATGLISVTGTAFVIYVGGRKALAGEISVGTFLVFIAYLRSTQHALESLLKLYGSFQPLFVGLERVFELLEPTAQERDASKLPAPKIIRFSRPPEIRFDDVFFEYEPGRPVLRRLNLEIRSGESIALVGASGAGKSTLLSLIPKLYDPTEGRILIDGESLSNLDADSYRDQIGFVFQESCLLRRSIRENIEYGSASVSLDETIAAARFARADGFIRGLPQGYETVLGERGVTISGGERQRISTARASLKGKLILLMDEPTSACDATTEADLVTNLRALARTRTIIIAAHRLSTIRWVDRIVVLERGAVVESGSPDELLRSGGYYYRLDKLQKCNDEIMEVAA